MGAYGHWTPKPSICFGSWPLPRSRCSSKQFLPTNLGADSGYQLLSLEAAACLPQEEALEEGQTQVPEGQIRPCKTNGETQHQGRQNLCVAGLMKPHVLGLHMTANWVSQFAQRSI